MLDQSVGCRQDPADKPKLESRQSGIKEGTRVSRAH